MDNIEEEKMEEEESFDEQSADVSQEPSAELSTVAEEEDVKEEQSKEVSFVKEEEDVRRSSALEEEEQMKEWAEEEEEQVDIGEGSVSVVEDVVEERDVSMVEEDYGDGGAEEETVEEEEGFEEGYVADAHYEVADLEEVLEEEPRKKVVSDPMELDDVVGELEEEEEEEEVPKEGEEAPKKQSDEADALLLDAWEEASEETESSLTQAPTPLDRQPLIDAYLLVMNDYAFVKRQNNFLHKKMCEYFQKRKMEHVLLEVTDHYEEAANKYYKRLENFNDLIEEDREKRNVISAEVQRLKTMRNVQMSNAKKNFREMIAREKEIGTGLISAKTGKEIPEKVLEKMINNQSHKAKELEQLRLSHIKIRNAVIEKHAAIRALDRIGDNYTLVEYEQLKIENQGHADKIEEKDEELSRLRRRCADAIQCLGHIKEKCAAVEHNIRIMRETLEEKEAERTVVRENLIQLKQQRDYYRQETQRLREENGLMTKDKMLVDMENSMKECDHLHSKLESMERAYERKKNKLDAIKVNYEKEKRKKIAVESAARESQPSLENRDSAVQYGRRPTIMMPKFEKGAFDYT